MQLAVGDFHILRVHNRLFAVVPRAIPARHWERRGEALIGDREILYVAPHDLSALVAGTLGRDFTSGHFLFP